MLAVADSIHKYHVDIEPVGRRIDVPRGATLLEAAQVSGVELVATCGGVGVCDSCKIRLLEGVLSAPSLLEEVELTPDDVAVGMRLACQAEIISDVRIEIPPSSLAATQRLQLEGRYSPLTEADSPGPKRPVSGHDVALTPPDMHDLRPDDTRIEAGLAHCGFGEITIGRAALKQAAGVLRTQNWQARLVMRGDELVATLSPGSRLLGLAFDVGTTKLAAYLVDLGNGGVLNRAGATNPQIAFGEDVVSRIAYANTGVEKLRLLQSRLVESLNSLTRTLCEGVEADPGQIVEVVAVGNTAMTHILAGLPVRQLGVSPYVPATASALEIQAADIGLEVAPAAYVYLPSNVAGYVGSDHVAMLLASRTPKDVDGTGPTLFIDIGTNTEVTLDFGGRMLTCSCASGPAFEGAHIRHGMRAAPGAVEHVHARVTSGNYDYLYHTIGNVPPVGICGSGILDTVAALRSTGAIDDRGTFGRGHRRIRADEHISEFVLVAASDTGNGRDIVVTQSDINEIQLAKAAIRAGIEVLLGEAGLGGADVAKVVLAGAFGTYLRVESAIEIGLFPAINKTRFDQVGNAAGVGAIQLLLSTALRDTAAAVPRNIEYVELTNHSRFNDAFVDALTL